MPVPDVTVVIPAYLAERTLQEAVDSVLRQSGCRPSVVVVVDGPGDRTEEIARTYDPDLVRVVVNETNLGAQRSRNRGLELVTTEHVMFLDSDDYLQGPLLEGLLARARSTGAGVVFGPWRQLDEGTGRYGPVERRAYRSPADLYLRWLGRNEFVPPCSVLWRKDALEAIGAWDPAIRRDQDGELVLRAVMLGTSFAESEQGCGVWVLHAVPGSLSTRRDTHHHMLDAPAALEGLPATTIDGETKQRGLAERYYLIARHCLWLGDDAVGRRALREARRLGLRGHRGRPPTVALATVVGLPMTARVRRCGSWVRTTVRRHAASGPPGVPASTPARPQEAETRV
ncbi:glycosyltransferase family 2 protein [Cellulomonas aerilata]|uniref:Glycosyltransferase 2-like domain-containing protein n=1 Tax=Cellulomonas aerilata TaxID=515326 RepID=A0A512DCV2_9CELL|nr:glycosyltransferase family 2 protein [Cellulomonas aerilata]GEO34306.1 hypothetical protein CAE01nite_20310 [Cellulomonas aerilata]